MPINQAYKSLYFTVLILTLVFIIFIGDYYICSNPIIQCVSFLEKSWHFREISQTYCKHTYNGSMNCT